MTGMLTLEELRAAFDAGEIDTVLAVQVDMQGRLMGKRFHAAHFLDSAHEETHGCNYLLATDMEMDTVDGYKSTSWEAGYGDYIMRPDLSTLRRIPWLEATAMVICDVRDHHNHGEIEHAPRSVLKAQMAKLEAMGLNAMAATELECFVFRQSYRDAAVGRYQNLETVSAYNQDYHIFQTTKEEAIMRAIRNGLYGAGIPVENTKGEADAGQEEINIRYADALDCADHHAIAKNGAKEIAWANGRSLTFMAKWNADYAGNSAHIHQSLWTLDGKPAFYDPDMPHGMSAMMRSYLAGLLKYSAETTLFLAPRLNSYKRFVAGTFAPTKSVWSLDNRTAGFRVCGADTKAVRVETRIGGADLNPYLGIAAQLAAGMAGIEEGLELEEAFSGDAYKGKKVPEVPSTLREAAEIADKSTMLRKAMGDDVVDHYVHAARHEQSVFDSAVTDWELHRDFERV